MVKRLPAMLKTWVQSLGSIPGSGRSPGEGNGNPLQYSCLGNPMDRGAWRATVCGDAKELDTTERLNDSRCWCGPGLKAGVRLPALWAGSEKGLAFVEPVMAPVAWSPSPCLSRLSL